MPSFYAVIVMVLVVTVSANHIVSGSQGLLLFRLLNVVFRQRLVSTIKNVLTFLIVGKRTYVAYTQAAGMHA